MVEEQFEIRYSEMTENRQFPLVCIGYFIGIVSPQEYSLVFQENPLVWHEIFISIGKTKIEDFFIDII